MRSPGSAAESAQELLKGVEIEGVRHVELTVIAGLPDIRAHRLTEISCGIEPLINPAQQRGLYVSSGGGARMWRAARG